MTQEIFKELLVACAKMVPGGVSPTNKFLLILDGHSSRIHPDCVDVAKELGFDLLLFPGALTQSRTSCSPWMTYSEL